AWERRFPSSSAASVSSAVTAERRPPPPSKGNARPTFASCDRSLAPRPPTAVELSGHAVDVAFSGPEGVAMTRALRPDVVICDIGLPGMDGYAVARALRADPELARVPLVALTGYAQPEDVTRAREAGFDAQLFKPATMEALLAQIEALSARP